MMKMMKKHTTQFWLRLFVGLSSLYGASTALAQGTAFTYQGHLTDNGTAATGSYDFRFTLYDALVGGSQVGPILTIEDVVVTGGLFTTSLDFGNAAFTGGSRWLEIAVRPGASTGAFTVVGSRQELTPTPIAMSAPWSGVWAKPPGFADDVDDDSGGDITGVAAGTGLAGGGTTGDVTLSLNTSYSDGRYVRKSGDTMTGTLTLSPAAGVGLSTSADINLLGRVMRGSAPFIQANTALYNTAVGENALQANTTGYGNTTTGADALQANTTGYSNTATGINALYSNTTGDSNTAMGFSALPSNTTGYWNTATGKFALYANTTGNSNTAMGGYALNLNTTGTNNIAVGYRAGYNATTGNYNIYIGNQGGAAEGNTIRIGDDNQTRFFAKGIYGVTTDFANPIPVLVDLNGQLGTVSSSIRYKEDVRDMADTSAALFQLRPVTFRYKGRPNVPEERHYGLVAEEVNEIIPELVAHSANGQVETVKYHELPAMLLNELQKLYREVQELRMRLAKIESR